MSEHQWCKVCSRLHASQPSSPAAPSDSQQPLTLARRGQRTAASANPELVKQDVVGPGWGGRRPQQHLCRQVRKGSRLWSQLSLAHSLWPVLPCSRCCCHCRCGLQSSGARVSIHLELHPLSTHLEAGARAQQVLLHQLLQPAPAGRIQLGEE